MPDAVLTAAPPLELRPYQRDALTAIEAAALRGVRRQVVSLPTGAGKTVIFAHLCLAQQGRTLILEPGWACYTGLWREKAPMPLFDESRAYPVHRCVTATNTTTTKETG